MEKKPFTIAEALNSEPTSQKTYGKADKKKSSGRKIIDKELRREHIIVCRLNQKEHDILKKLMELDLSSESSSYIRKLILKEARVLNVGE
ncbi:hypothetical protein LS70_008665 [Helicobacter sp. MIT 11-5569]|jgi:hypothetical protein|uniref:hypothetical protein n=1 Tax=Helicobacter TaxID=209 RepID=UPI000479C7EC|nr:MULTISPECIES: hypothetical protein [Helicobacter]TLD80741.1 hypothetical protein LS70_008665 [Helicobacter sp. MIT 11-5569]